MTLDQRVIPDSPEREVYKEKRAIKVLRDLLVRQVKRVIQEYRVSQEPRENKVYKGMLEQMEPRENKVYREYKDRKAIPVQEAVGQDLVQRLW